MLPATATVTIGRRDRTAEIEKEEMVRRLNLDEKLKLVMPMIDGGLNIAGTAAWERYLHLKGLRDALVHVDRRGYAADPDERTRTTGSCWAMAIGPSMTHSRSSGAPGLTSSPRSMFRRRWEPDEQPG
jgi:hypothetical protein